MHCLPARDLDHVLERTRDWWGELRGNRLFITGGTGFFGCWLLESFAWANDRLGLNAGAVVLTRDPGAFSRKAPHLASHASIRVHQGDIRHFTFPAGSFSHVIHAATEASAVLNREDPLAMLDTLVGGTRLALDFAVAGGAEKFLLTSSGAVYGKLPPGVTSVPEDYTGGPDPQNPSSAYAEGKRMAELLCAIYRRRHRLETRIARGFAFLGPYLPLDAHFAAGNFIRGVLKGGPVVMNSGGTAVRSYLYAADLAVWLWTILFRGKPDYPYNVGSDQPVSIRNLALAVAGAGGVDVIGPPPGDDMADVYVPDISRARRELGLGVEVPLEEAIRRTLEWYRTGAAVEAVRGMGTPVSGRHQDA